MRAKLNNHFKARNSLQSVPPGVTQHDLPCVVQKKRCPSKNYTLLNSQNLVVQQKTMLFPLGGVGWWWP